MRCCSMLLLVALGVAPALAQTAGELNERAVTLGHAGNHGQAVRLLEQAVRLAPENEVIARNLGVMHINQAGQLARQGEYAQADRAFEAGLPYLGHGPESHNAAQSYAAMLANWGQQLMYAGDPAAEPTLLKALDHDRNQGGAHWVLGNHYYQVNRHDEALHHLEWAMELTPEHQDAIADLIAKAQTEMEVESGFTRKTQGGFTVSFEGREQQDLANSALRELRRAHRDVGRALGYFTDRRIEVTIYTAAQFTEVTLLPDWVPGAFDGKIRLRAGDLRVMGNEEGLRNLIYHEYGHALIYWLSQGRAPVWLHEGLAQSFERSTRDAGIRLVGLPPEVRQQIEAQLAQGVGGYLAALDAQLTRRENHADTAAAYEQAESLVSFLIRRGGYRSTRNVLQNLGNGQGMAAALQAEYGTSQADLLERWIRSLDDGRPLSVR